MDFYLVISIYLNQLFNVSYDCSVISEIITCLCKYCLKTATCMHLNIPRYKICKYLFVY